ncbi:DUF3592 domain-containing protein [Sphingomonas sp.]|uniref:DUF3592 domain-containing protein n=1 Tax=Sphingomonas sp. TaxID=28214 RepID=UPI0031DD76B5
MAEDNGNRRSILGEEGSLHRALVGPLIVGTMLLFRTGLPALFDKGHRIDDLIHGDALPFAAGSAFLYLICTLGYWIILRRARTHDPIRTKRIGMAIIAAIVMLLAEAYFVIPDVIKYRLASDLTVRGVPAQAELIRHYARGCGKAACTDAVQYRFTPRGRTHSIEGSVDVLSGRARGTHERIDYVEATGTVPILYDPQAPRRAMFFWKDDVASTATVGGSFAGIIALNVILMIVIIPFALILWRDLAKQRRAVVENADRS